MPGCNFLRSLFFLLFAFSWIASADDRPNPEFEAQFRQGQELLTSGKYKEAIAAFRKAAKLRDDHCSSCAFAIALAYIRTEQLEDALKSCDATIQTATDDSARAAGHNLKGIVLLGLAGKDAKKLEIAEKEERTAVQLDARMATYHLALARALLRQGDIKDAEAKKELESCLTLHPDARTAEDAQLLLADPRRGREEFAPSFSFTTLQGQLMSLKDLGGRIVVIDFWATWCPPCRESVPELKELTRKYPSDKLVLISISADDDEQAWRNFIARKNMDWAQYRDSDQKIRQSFHVNAFPTYLVIDGDGIVRQRIVGLNPRQSVVSRLKETLARMPQLEDVAQK